MPQTFNQPDTILSTTLANYSKTLADNIFVSTPFFYFLVGRSTETPGQSATARGRMRTLDGGATIVQPVLYEGNSTAGSYAKYDLLDVTPQEGISAAQYNWKSNAVSITISGEEEDKNAGSSTRIVALLEAKMKQAKLSLQEELNGQLLGAGTDSGKDMLGLQTIVSTTGTVGGISRSANAWWQSNVTSSVGSFAANGLDAMRTMFNTASKGNETPDFILTTQSVFESYEKTLQPQERFQNTSAADAGFQNLTFKGKPIVFDNAVATGAMYFINSEYLELVLHSATNFRTTPFVKPANQDAKTAQILVRGELTATNCKRHGALTGITA